MFGAGLLICVMQAGQVRRGEGGVGVLIKEGLPAVECFGVGREGALPWLWVCTGREGVGGWRVRWAFSRWGTVLGRQRR